MRLKFFYCVTTLWLGVFIAGLQVRAAESPWARVVMIGASASAGFVLDEPLGGAETTRCKLNYYLDAAITKPHAPVKNFGSALMFLNPEAFAPLQVEAATNNHPTLVIGVDFLFWFCYGDGNSDAARAARFETGLKLLEQIHCPLVVGDIPDASSATNTGIISVDMVPSEAARRAANARLKIWAKAHPQVVVMPLAKLMRDIMANATLTLHGQTLPAGKTRALLQADQLHPNPHGAAVLTLGILDALTAKETKFPAAEIRWNSEEVFRLGCQAADDSRKP
ncbi:MAG TPA: hypothetical protein VIK62_09205 [Verrucomicrobiae bacterium]